MDHLAKRTQAGHQPHLPVFNSLPQTDVTSEWQNEDASPDLLRLLSQPRHGLAYLSYCLKLYTISICFSQGLLCAGHNAES